MPCMLELAFRNVACANRLYFGLMLRRAKAGRKRSCSKKKLERDDDSTKSHPALGVRYQEINGSNSDIEFRLPLTPKLTSRWPRARCREVIAAHLFLLLAALTTPRQPQKRLSALESFL